MADYAGCERDGRAARPAACTSESGCRRWVEICGLAPSAVTHAIGTRIRGWESSTVRCTRPARYGRHRLVAHGQGHETSWSQIVADRARHSVRRHRRAARRHAALALRHRHLRLALARRRRHRAPAGAATRCATRRARSPPTMLECAADDLEFERGHVLGQGLARAREDDRRSSPARRSPAHDLPEGMEPNLEAHDLPRPAELHVPVRHAHRRGRGRPARPARSRSSATWRSTTAATRSTRDRRGPGARRHRPGDRAGALRGDASTTTTASC